MTEHLGLASRPTRMARMTRHRWRLNVMSVVIGLIALVGLFTVMYPATASWWSQWNQSRVIRQYVDQIKVDPAPGNAARLEQAREYNAKLNTGEITVGESNKPTITGQAGEDLDYWNLLSTGGRAMARLKIPVINVDLPVYHGTSDATLEKGIGHLQGTSLPVGGVDTHAVLTGHRGLASATLFDNLNKLKNGDTFIIETAGEVLTYQVFETQVVDPGDTQAILPRAGKDIVTLVTCTPLGINTQRILVTGERILPTPATDAAAMGKSPDIPGFPWWAVVLPGGVLLVGVYIWRSGRIPRPAAARSIERGGSAE